MASPEVVRLRRTWPQRILISFNLFLIASLLTGASGLGYFYWRTGQIPRINFGEDILDEAAGPAFNMLLVGSDTRANLTGDQAILNGQGAVSGQRADTIMVLRVEPETATARLLSIPRDLYVDIDGGGRSRINSAFADGPDRLIRTVALNLGIEINHYAQVDFVGFQGLVKTVGGVKVYFPGPARDRIALFDVPEGGCIKLSGEQALAYVRSRNYEVFESGRWRTDPTGDFGRIERQQDFLRRVVKAVSGKETVLNPASLNRIVQVAIRNIQLDDKLNTKQLLQLARRFRNLDPSTVEMFTVPARPATIGGASVLLLQETEAEPILAKFRAAAGEDGPATPAATRVRILNGSGTGGVAGNSANLYQELGFVVTGTGDADSFGYERTQVRYAPGNESKAQLVASHLASGALYVADPNLTDTDVVVVLGADFAGVTARPIPGTKAPDETPPPTTTIAPTTTAAPSGGNGGGGGGGGGGGRKAQGADPASLC